MSRRQRASIDYAKLAGGSEDKAGSEATGGGVWRAPAGRDPLREELLRHFERGASLSCSSKPATGPAELLSLEAGQPVKYTAAGASLFARPEPAQLQPEALLKLLGPEAEVCPKSRRRSWPHAATGCPAGHLQACLAAAVCKCQDRPPNPGSLD